MTAGTARTVGEWEAGIGRQVRELRLRADRTQAELARDANVSESSLRALERGRGSTLATLAAVVRALARTDWLDSLSPPVTVSPMAMLADRNRQTAAQRQRARGSRGRR